ncbi:hypothetical protein Pfo_020966, partial [Paulownia fortunei]
MKNSTVISMLCLAVLLTLFTPSLGKVHVVQMEIETVSSEFWGNMQQARCPEKFDVLMLGITKANALVRSFVQKI